MENRKEIQPGYSALLTIMKRIRREPAKFDVLKLFTTLGRNRGFIFGDKQSEKQFLDSISTSLLHNKSNSALLHGLQAQDLFQYVAASLGKCVLIKEEDAGELLAYSQDIRLPDYLLVLHDKSRFLVEVKNCHKKNPPCSFAFKKTYVESLLRYADLVNIDLMIAIYWSAWNWWSLVHPDQFECADGKYSISMSKAIEMNEMEIIGDFSIGTVPPLILRMFTDKKKPRSIGRDGKGQCTIGEIQLLCKDKKITNKTEKMYAFYFMLFGDWESKAPFAQIDDNKLISIDYIVEPTTRTPGQRFEMLGFMSGMISRWYRQLISTSSDGDKVGVDIEPNSLGLDIPKNYKGKVLPLWVFHLHPKYKKCTKPSC